MQQVATTYNMYTEVVVVHVHGYIKLTQYMYKATIYTLGS